ncbi:MAG: winged helix-turn-helix transcriptional regulator [Erysipelotrichaceae bacterium]|nr:winged helix-turn-helix transcriptional regulator [Erysipelotrichaceae bacterium]
MALQETTKALADPIRRAILNLLKEGPMTAGDIQSKFDVTFASISRHLSVLKDADLIRDRREGKFIYYELNASILEEVLLWIYSLKGEKNEKV